MSLIGHAKIEMKEWLEGDDEIQKDVAENVLGMLEALCKFGHSGTSLFYTLDIFNRVARYKPLGPLTGKDDEWNEVGDDLWQNKRCSAVFKTSAEAYYIDGRVFVEKDGNSFTTMPESRTPVTFPYSVPENPEFIHEQDCPRQFRHVFTRSKPRLITRLLRLLAGGRK